MTNSVKVLNIAETENVFKKYFSKQLTSKNENDIINLVADEAIKKRLFFEN